MRYKAEPGRKGEAIQRGGVAGGRGGVGWVRSKWVVQVWAKVGYDSTPLNANPPQGKEEEEEGKERGSSGWFGLRCAGLETTRGASMEWKSCVHGFLSN